MTAYERTPSLRCRRGALSALVIAALLASMLTSLPAAGADGFSDVSSGSTHEPAIDALAEMGVFDDTECGDGLFCPGDPIDRWVMAVWLIRVLGGEVTTSTTSRFADVDASEWWSALRRGTRRPRHNRRMQDRPPPLLPRRLRHPSPDGHLLRPRLRPRKRLPGRVHRHRRQRA